MDRKCKVVVAIILMCSVISFDYSEGVYGVFVGETYSYDVLESNKSYLLDTNSSYSEGFTLGGIPFNCSQRITIQVDNIIDHTIYYNTLLFENITLDFGRALDSWNLYMSYLKYMLYPVYHIEHSLGLFDEWNLTALQKMGGPFIKPFFETGIGLIQDFSDLLELNGTSLDGAKILVHDEEFTSISQYVFEFYLEGNLSNSFIENDKRYVYHGYTKHVFQFYCATNNGVIMGQRMKGEFTGTTNSTPLEFSYNYHTELKDRDMPDLVYWKEPPASSTTSKKGGVTIPATVFLACSLGVLTIILKKKKRYSIQK